jgi:secondary thiamine-phosphate synthase enzyme
LPLLEIQVRTPDREVFVDITERVRAALTQGGFEGPSFYGLVTVFVPHTTAGVTINEGADPSVVRDILESLRRVAPRTGDYEHREGNSDAHVKASLMGSSVTIPVEGGRLRLGTWQSIYLAEFDGPRTRRVWIMPVPTTTSMRAP